MVGSVHEISVWFPGKVTVYPHLGVRTSTALLLRGVDRSDSVGGGAEGGVGDACENAIRRASESESDTQRVFIS